MNDFITNSKDYQSGRVAAQLGEPFDYNKSLAWWLGYRNEIINRLADLLRRKEN